METTFDAFVARLLAAGGFVLVAIILVLTRAAFRTNPEVPVSMRIAIQIGFVALDVCSPDGSIDDRQRHDARVRGKSAQAYATGGSLKPTHAVTMHAILLFPLLAWLLSFADWSEHRRLGAVLVAAGGYVVLAGVVALGNLAGLEPWRLPLSAVVVLSVGAFSLIVVAS